MAEKRKAETSTEEPRSKVNKTANVLSKDQLIDENETLKKKIAELKKRHEEGQKMTKDMHDILIKRINEAESEAFNTNSKLSMLKHLTQNTYITPSGFNLSEEIINVIFRNDKKSELPREEMRRTPVIRYKNYVLYYINKKDVFYDKPKPN